MAHCRWFAPDGIHMPYSKTTVFDLSSQRNTLRLLVVFGTEAC